MGRSGESSESTKLHGRAENSDACLKNSCKLTSRVEVGRIPRGTRLICYRCISSIIRSANHWPRAPLIWEKSAPSL